MCAYDLRLFADFNFSANIQFIVAHPPNFTSRLVCMMCSLGMKAYKSINDESDLRLFRPELNMKRLKDSMARLAMQGCDFDPQELIHCIGKLVRLGECY